MVEEAEVRQIAANYIREEIQPRISGDLAISDIDEFPACWVVTYNSRKYLESGSFRDALAGNGPLIINKRTGTVRVGLTGQPVEDQLDHDLPAR